MYRRLIVMLVLLAGLLALVSGTFAAPPDPIKVSAVVRPTTAHVGDTVTLTCHITPTQGSVIQFIGYGFGAGYSGDTFIRGFGDHGPVIVQITLNTSTPGTYEGFCSGRAILDGVPYDAEELITVEILP